MAQFDVYRLRNRPDLVVDCQTGLLDHLDSRFVVPLVARDRAPAPAGRLNPVFEIEGAEYVMLTQAAGAVRTRELGDEIASLAERDREIVNAFDLLLTGV